MLCDNKKERLHLYCEASFIKAIDDYGFGKRIRTRATAIRELIKMGLEASEEKAAGEQIAVQAPAANNQHDVDASYQSTITEKGVPHD